MDGRIQEPIRKYLKENYKVKYVDTITEPGPCKILAENKERALIDSILQRIKISINNHKSHLIAISGHHDCAGNPCPDAEQKEQVKRSVEYLKGLYPEVEVIGFWIDSNWEVITDISRYKV